jgi:hypothetical protein
MLRLALASIAILGVAACLPMSVTGSTSSCTIPQRAYERGYNAALQGEQMRTGWIDAYCAPENRDAQRQAYMSGYQAATQGGRATVTIATPGYAVAPPTQCMLGSDGYNTCGYNCRLGSNGHAYCSSVANGHCALNSDGTFSCP